MDRSLYLFSRIYGSRFGRKALKYSLVNPAALPRGLVWRLHLYRFVLGLMLFLLAVFAVFTGWWSFFIALGSAAKVLLEESLDRALEPFLRAGGGR
ncbi:MAG: hypothetical protein GC185_12820 [Alphaproteobacteria bacterium]|nr:hypothetical protein [Alphaproteobacteria bacterium]